MIKVESHLDQRITLLHELGLVFATRPRHESPWVDTYLVAALFNLVLNNLQSIASQYLSSHCQWLTAMCADELSGIGDITNWMPPVTNADITRLPGLQSDFYTSIDRCPTVTLAIKRPQFQVPQSWNLAVIKPVLSQLAT
jgi:hypothetical protein